jgi:hypothetical protein
VDDECWQVLRRQMGTRPGITCEEQGLAHALARNGDTKDAVSRGRAAPAWARIVGPMGRHCRIRRHSLIITS